MTVGLPPRRSLVSSPIASGCATVAMFAVVWVWPWGAAGLVAAALVTAALARQRSKREVDARTARELPEVIDLLRVFAGGGFTVHLAVASVAETAPGAIASALGAAVRAASAGASLADALEDFTASLGPAVRPLVSVLAASERYGTAVGPSLERLAADARADERRRGEANARRVPVRLLFPLVFCVLPAFALLTLAPLVAGGLESLRLP